MLSLSLDTMLALYLQKLAALDRYDCGKRYLCELAASEQPDLAGQLALDLFQVEGLYFINTRRRGIKYTYSYTID